MRRDRFHLADVDATARRLLILIDGLAAQKVIRDATTDEIEHIARSYMASELRRDLTTSPR